MTTKRVRATKATAPSGTCACGCGGSPKGPKSKFLPGHDAKMAAATKRAAVPAATKEEAAS